MPRWSKRSLKGYSNKDVLFAARNTLTPLQERFVAAYVDKDGPGYLSSTKAYMEAQPGSKITTAQSYSSELLAKPHIKLSVKEALESAGLKEKVEKSLLKIVDGFNEGDKNYRARDVIAVADMTYKVCGDYAPEKQVVMNLTPEARDQEYEALIKKIREAQEANKT